MDLDVCGKNIHSSSRNGKLMQDNNKLNTNFWTVFQLSKKSWGVRYRKYHKKNRI